MLRSLMFPAALIAGLGLATADRAQAAPLSAGQAVLAGHALGGLRIGVGVGIPIGGPRYASQPTGYWTTQTVPTTVQVQVPVQVAVQVPDHVIGTDVYGQPIWSYRTEFRTEYRTEYRTQYVTQQVWVNTGYVTYPTSRPWGHVGLGLGFRIR